MPQRLRLEYGVTRFNKRKQYAVVIVSCALASILLISFLLVRQRVHDYFYWKNEYKRALAEQNYYRAYVLPPSRIVYEEDPNRWPALLSSSPCYARGFLEFRQVGRTNVPGRVRQADSGSETHRLHSHLCGSD